MASVTHTEIDAAEIYDCFTYVVPYQIEDLGFCAKGEGDAFIEGGVSESVESCPSRRTADCWRRRTRWE
jgi:acetyl-CoA acetyltransferase